MPSTAKIQIRKAARDEFDVASDFWLAMRRELSMPDSDMPADWKTRAVDYFQRRHDAGELCWFFALDGQIIVGSACGFVKDGYPSEMLTNRKIGYIAGVYVKPDWRRNGIARAVTQAAVDWLWNIGCARIDLHAAVHARPIYEAMGFIASNEMVLKPTR